MTMQASTAAAPRFAVPDSAAATAAPGVGSLLEVMLALIVVVAVIMACAWLARRLRAGSGSAGAIRVVAEVGLGAKERAVLLQVHGRQVLVGVAAGAVTTLHVFSAEELPAGTPDGTAPATPAFADLLRRGLGMK